MTPLIVLDGYETPDPSTYKVTLKNVNGATEQMENGDVYIERIRSQAATIEVDWKNLLDEETQEILAKIKEPGVAVTYWNGEYKTAQMTADEPLLELITDADVPRWHLSFRLEEVPT